MPPRRIATVLMLDIVGSTHIAAQLGDARYRELSSRFNRLVRASLRRFGGKEEDHAGDGFFATFPQPDQAIRCAASLAEDVRSLGIEIRSGIHTGQTEDQAGKTHGIAVVIGARVMSLADAGEILVTSTTKELAAGSGFAFEDFSPHELKGVPGTWQVFAVASVEGVERPGPLPPAEAAERRATIQSSTGRQRPSPRTLIVTGSGLLVALAALVFALTRGNEGPHATDGPKGPVPESVVQIDPVSGRRLMSIPAPVEQRGLPGMNPPSSAHTMVVGQGGVWIRRSFRSLYHVDPQRGEVRSRITLDTGQTFSINVAEGSDKIWVAYSGGLIEVNPSTDEQRHVIHFPQDTTPTSADVAAGGGFVWIGTGSGQLLRVDPRSGDRRTQTGLGTIDTIAFGHGSVWTADTLEGIVTRYDSDSLRPIARIEIPTGVDYLAAGDTAVWALSLGVGSLTEIDVVDNVMGRIVQVGEAPAGLAAGGGAIWIGDEDGVIRRVDEDTREVTEIPFGAGVGALAFDDDTDTLWVDVA